MRFTKLNLAILACLAILPEYLTLDNGLALTPPMGFMTWQRYRCTTNCLKYPNECISDSLLRKITDLMVDQGFLLAGYNYIIIDDCWLDKNRSADGYLQEDKTRFPYGMPALINYIHSRGFKFGIYEDYGSLTCAGYPGLLNNEKKDIGMFADWGVDYIKVDGCYYDGMSYAIGYETLGRYLNQTGRPVVYSCSYPAYDNANSVPIDFKRLAKNCNLWRNYDDIQDSWSSLLDIIDHFALKQELYAKFAGPGHWNDPDMLLIGNFGLSYDQSKTQMAIWAILGAPLLISTDLANIRPEMKEILLNKQIIKINQDPLGIQGLRVYRASDIEVWTRKVTPTNGEDYSYAIAICSRRTDGFPYPFTLSFKRIGLISAGGYEIKDLYTNEEYHGIYYANSNLSVRVNPTGVIFLKATVLAHEQTKLD